MHFFNNKQTDRQTDKNRLGHVEWSQTSRAATLEFFSPIRFIFFLIRGWFSEQRASFKADRLFGTFQSVLPLSPSETYSGDPLETTTFLKYNKMCNN